MNLNTVYLVIATVVQTGLLIWGLKMISEVLRSTSKENGPTFAREMLSEKTPPDGDGDKGEEPGSFSRITGSIGAVVLAAFFAGVSYWALYTLFSNGDLSKLEKLGTFFLVGSALFAPYAFNKLSSIFK